MTSTDRADLRGARVLVVHGTDDRIAYVVVPGARHAMLRHGRTFETYAAEFVTATLLGVPPRSEALAAVLDGAAYVEG